MSSKRHQAISQHAGSQLIITTRTADAASMRSTLQKNNPPRVLYAVFSGNGIASAAFRQPHTTQRIQRCVPQPLYQWSLYQ